MHCFGFPVQELAKVCVLGAGGFLGKTLLHQQSMPFRCLVRNIASIESHVGLNKAEWVCGDFLDENALRDALRGCSSIVHLVSSTLPATADANPYLNIHDNLLGTIKLLDIAVEMGIKKIVFLSSGGTVYGRVSEVPISEVTPANPISAYGIGKLAIEHHMQLYQALYGLRCVILRVSNPYGIFQSASKMQGVIPIFVRKALAHETIHIWGDGSVVRDYIHADDVACAITRSLLSSSFSGVVNIGSGEGYSLIDIITIIEDLVGYKLNVEFNDARSLDVPINILGIERARHELGWMPKIDLGRGISALINALKKQ